MPKAVINGVVIAEAPESEVFHIEGNVYFPPSSVKTELLKESPTPYTCPWKGACQYYSVDDGGTWLQDRAFAYPDLYDGAVERVGGDFAGYIVFWKEVQVTD
ncbi:DUF427 domain-containing protein [Homoserinibacter sp. YIM 151385]|uniref:DUF427 domain-containing protein n=1 Tax=Homoserinibacter sp. YIM 151385 TaxID=2985506 RepID=UPI0022F036DA|nr:DUF427 domain-containing protein [Homoserinibacter sp. YIM 151385]WBU37631.1 DUF427 domain-containing protein [Homoserinibacter sp. YIM 151385]